MKSEITNDYLIVGNHGFYYTIITIIDVVNIFYKLTVLLILSILP